MEKTLTKVCEYLNNYFWDKKISGRFKIENGTIEVSALKEGQYFRILGSTLNEGVYKYPVSNLKDEEFSGYIWSMVVPQAVIDLASKIEEWETKYATVDSATLSPFNSESFGNYSYSKGSATGSSGSGKPNGWQAVFSSELAPYRRLRNI